MPSGRAARALLLLQVGVRLFTFVVNQLLLRTVSPAVFGAAHVQLELVLSIALSLARDGVRAAVLRAPPTRPGPTTTQALHNLALVPAAAGGVLAAVVGGVYLRYMAPPALWTQAGAALPVSVALYGLGAWLELLAEPLHARALALPQYVRVRVGMEAGGVLARALVLVLLLPPARLQWLRTHGEPYLTVPSGELPWALIAFALARAAYGAAVWVVAAVSLAHLLSWAEVARALWPSWHAPLFATPETRALVRVTTTQAVLKLVLTEGDKLALTRLTSLAHQGGYALASNYGSVVARTVFQPLEESVRLQLAHRTDEAGMVHALTLLQVLLRAHLLLGAVLVALGPPLARPALRLVAGAAWAAPSSPAAPILATYCWYVPVMGLNGLLEAFVQAVAPPDVLSRYSRVLVASSAAFVAVLAAAHVLDAESAIVWANVVALGVRAGAAYAYVQRHEAPTPQAPKVTWRALMPRAHTLALCAVCAAVLRSAPAQTWTGLWPLGLGGGLALGLYVCVTHASVSASSGARAPRRGPCYGRVSVGRARRWRAMRRRVGDACREAPCGAGSECIEVSCWARKSPVSGRIRRMRIAMSVKSAVSSPSAAAAALERWCCRMVPRER